MTDSTLKAVCVHYLLSGIFVYQLVSNLGRRFGRVDQTGLFAVPVNANELLREDPVNGRVAVNFVWRVGG
jgi:hypothetical protein